MKIFEAIHRFTVFLFPLLLMAASARADTPVYLYSTIAGSAGLGSADGTNGAASFYYPTKCVIDGQSNVFVVDSGNRTIRRISPMGTNWVTTTIAGNPSISDVVDGTNGNALFGQVHAITMDLASNLYVTDGSFIRRVSPVGTNWVVTSLVGGGTAGQDGINFNAGFSGPMGLTVDPATNIYVADTQDNLIRRISIVGTNWVVTTIAGLTYTAGTNDGSNTLARFNNPYGIRVDAHTNIFVADYGNCTVRKIVRAGTNWAVTTIAGLGGAYGGTDGIGSAARFNSPSDVVIDASTNLYLTDFGGCTIRKLSQSGGIWSVATLAGLHGTAGFADGSNSVARFYQPAGIAMDGQTNLYVADYYNYLVRRVAPAGTNWITTTIAGTFGGAGRVDGTNAVARFSEPYGVTVDNMDNVLVADADNGAIRKLTPSGANWLSTTIAGNPPNKGFADGTNRSALFVSPRGLATDGQGNYFISDYAAHTIRKMTSVGTNWVVTTLAGSGGVSGTNDGTNSLARFNSPTGLTVDTQSNVFVADTYNHVIRRLSPKGTNWVVTTIAGKPEVTDFVDGTNQNARFSEPSGIVRDPDGNLYVADSSNHAIRKLTPVGTNWVVTTLAGGYDSGSLDGTNTDAQFTRPGSIARDSAGNLYVGEDYNNLIRRLTHIGTNWVVTTIAGSSGTSQYADGTNSQARFRYPAGLAVDARGNLFIADTFNNTVRLGQPYSLSLQIFPAANRQVAVYWPSWSTNTLQMTTNLRSNLWNNVAGVMQQGASFVSTNATVNAAGYFRLH